MNKKNIIFDLGGIFIRLDYRRTKDAFVNLGAIDFYDYFVDANNAGLLRDFEIGKVSAAHFRREVRHLFLLKDVDDDAVDNAWNAMLLETLPDRIELLKSLRKNYQL